MLVLMLQITLFKGKLDFDIDWIISIPTNDLINALQTKKRFNDENLSTLADILSRIVDCRSSEQERLNERYLAIYNYLEKENYVYSFDRYSNNGI